MSRSAAYWVLALGLAVGGLSHGSAPVPPRSEIDLDKLVSNHRADGRHLAERLIAVVEDLSLPEDKRWEAVVTLGDLSDRVATEYLVEHITLQIRPPGLLQSEDRGERQVCYFVLTTRRPGSGGEDDWNHAQAVLRAVGKRRTQGELVAYARVLELSLGNARYSDGMVPKRSRALALVEAELATEQMPTLVYGCQNEDRRDRLN